MLETTREIADLLEAEPQNEGNWSGGEESKMYTAFNDAGVECEVGEYLYGLVRMMKPYHILETGTHQGMSTLYMAKACKANGRGIIETIEFLPEHYRKADETFNTAGLKPYIMNYQADVRTWKPRAIQYQIMLLDTEPQLRFAEMVKFYEYLTPGGFVFIHDLHRHMGQVDNAEHGYAWPWGVIPAELELYVKTDQLKPFHFSTPRGLTGFYKPSPNDYNWRKE